MVVDNAEELISNDKVSFRSLVRFVIVTCTNLKVILTSRQRLASFPECAEDVYFTTEINATASWQLFR